MKEKVLIITEVCPDTSKSELIDMFPSEDYDVTVIDTENKEDKEIGKLIATVSADIYITWYDTAKYAEPIRNYKRKYLINPELLKDPIPNVRDYDRENTYGLFGFNDWAITKEREWIYSLNYSKSIMFSFYEMLFLKEGVNIIVGLDNRLYKNGK